MGVPSLSACAHPALGLWIGIAFCDAPTDHLAHQPATTMMRLLVLAMLSSIAVGFAPTAAARSAVAMPLRADVPVVAMARAAPKKAVKKAVKKAAPAKKVAPKKAVVAKKAPAKKAPPKKTPPKKTVAKAAPPKKAPAPKRSEIKRTIGKTTADFRPGRQYASRGSSFNLGEMFGFKIARDATGGTPAGGKSKFKPLNIIK